MNKRLKAKLKSVPKGVGVDKIALLDKNVIIKVN